MPPALPSIGKRAFNCPRCQAYANQKWYALLADEIYYNGEPVAPQDVRAKASPEAQQFNTFENGPQIVTGTRHSHAVVANSYISHCANCRKSSFWIAEKLVYPEVDIAVDMNPDTPQDIAADYREAASILQRSPRGAAALLRLGIQKLCKHLGEPGKNINDDIASLVKKGLDPRIQRALDVLRVVGNEAVHPGTLDLNDDPDTALSLFRFFNLIVEKMISEPKHVDDVYSKLPADKLKAIENRDK
ncbi:DUF4145 domain-containing protein [Rhizobium leguminosarum]|uniref:DUF4145 domain-containing protein n=1 Tax=Rhizobium leguminosarum TaxID=384 RepID=UPI00027D8F4B|nr:DUF4145 domain-containing protein [Rhizobium leguminosarum]RWY88573.1 DUF4145 domain-containing protein [Rhizobium leguminosarum]TAY16787.1 DUF4145 domain-containing protein [Rhizobium leguminosarum]